MTQLFFRGIAMAALIACSSAPHTDKIETVHEIHGHQRVDYYHWLKDPTRKNTKVLEHLKVENDYANSFFESARSLQKKLYGEILGRVNETDSEVPVFENGFFYYSRTEKGKDYPIYCRKKGSLQAPEQVILDMNEVAGGKTNVSLGDLAVSPDQSILAYAIDEKGEEIYTIFFKELDSGRLFTDQIARVTPNFIWANDNRTVFFTRYNEAFRPYQVYRYQIAGSGEKLVYEDRDSLFNVGLSRSKDNKYLFMNSASFTSSEYYYLEAQNPMGQWQLIQRRQPDLEYEVAHREGWFYIRNNKDAINFKVSRAPVNKPQLENWADYIMHDENALIVTISMQRDRLIYQERRDGLSRIRYIDFNNGGRYELNFTEPVYEVGLGENPDYQAQFVRLEFESPVTPKIVYDYDFAQREYIVQKRLDVPNYNPQLYEAKSLLVTAQDGQKIPVTLLYKNGLQLNGSAPCLLYGYGSYGITITPRFRSSVLSLVDRGFVYAIAHVRGGQAKGRRWYDEGKLLNKKNTFNDFIDVARGLIAAQYTSANKLAIRGGSAGGLLVGAVMNQRPDLFRAVVAEVPFVDVLSTILDPNLRFSTQEYLQWGNPNELAPYEYILSYSPYDQIKKEDYPAVLAVAGLHDYRVNYWEPAKWVAKLREFNSGDNPILLRTHMDAGHGGANARYQQYAEEAEIQAFILKTLGMED